jgi:hypothetical protein
MNAVHYAHPTTVRWRRGRWGIEHAAHSAVCIGGSKAMIVTYMRNAVTCRRCLRIVALINAYVPPLKREVD